MVDKYGNGVLLDFGLSRLKFETTRTLTNIQASGMLRFLAPELSTGENEFRTTEKTDTYSFGMLIYQLLYDVVPFDDLRNDLAVLKAVDAQLTPRRPNLPVDRAMLSTWRDMETKLWPLLQATWMEQEERTDLKAVHKAVGSLCSKGRAKLSSYRYYP